MHTGAGKIRPTRQVVPDVNKIRTGAEESGGQATFKGALPRGGEDGDGRLPFMREQDPFADGIA